MRWKLLPQLSKHHGLQLMPNMQAQQSLLILIHCWSWAKLFAGLQSSCLVTKPFCWLSTTIIVGCYPRLLVANYSWSLHTFAHCAPLALTIPRHHCSWFTTAIASSSWETLNVEPCDVVVLQEQVANLPGRAGNLLIFRRHNPLPRFCLNHAQIRIIHLSQNVLIN